MDNRLEIIQHYKKYFKVVKADTDALKNLAYKLRYQVYIEECSYDIDKDDEKKIEVDTCDGYALHCLLFHIPSNQAIGCIRLIPSGNEHLQNLPLAEFFDRFYDQEIVSNFQAKTAITGEISRMALAPSFRRRFYDTQIQGGEINQEEDKRRFKINYLPMCLTLAGLSLMFDAKVDYALAMMDKNLAILLKHFGVQHHKISDSVNYHGLRAAYLIFTEDTYNNLKPEFQELFKVIRDEIQISDTRKQQSGNSDIKS